MTNKIPEKGRRPTPGVRVSYDLDRMKIVPRISPPARKTVQRDELGRASMAHCTIWKSLVDP